MAYTKPSPARGLALRALVDVIRDGHSLDVALESHLSALPQPVAEADTQTHQQRAEQDRRKPPNIADRESGLAAELCFGVLRWLERLRAITAQVLERPLKRRDIEVEITLLMALYQLEYTRVPEHAAVSTAVNLVRECNKPWATGLVNGCLRRYLREQDLIRKNLADDPVTVWAHPTWLVAAISSHWPAQRDAILAANQARAPMTLRINRALADRASYLQTLADAGIQAQATRFSPVGVRLCQPTAVEVLPGFAEGVFSVQDEAAQLAAQVLIPAPGARVLDACAAPGGKTAHLLESHPHMREIVALDISRSRLERLESGLRRLGLTAHTIPGDAGQPGQWWDGESFDAILVDAPCSATGVIRRHPDIKLRRDPSELARTTSRQSEILTGLWSLLRPGGHLLYATCSILPEENDTVIEAFIRSHPDASVQSIDAPWGTASITGRQVLPGEDDMDGFFYALLAKG